MPASRSNNRERAMRRRSVLPDAPVTGSSRGQKLVPQLALVPPRIPNGDSNGGLSPAHGSKRTLRVPRWLSGDLEDQ